MINIPRISRNDIKTPFLHIMVQGINKEYIFEDEKYIELYLKLIKKYAIEYKIIIIAYCIMNNHAHVLIYTENISNVGKFMQKLNLNYSRFYNKEKNRCGVIFRNRYKTEQILNQKYLINCIKYIHMNPVKAKIVKDCKDYKYSSYNEYINHGAITKTEIMIEIFGNKCDYYNIFKGESRYRFNEIESFNDNEIREFIDNSINDFIKEKNTELCNILSDRDILKELIKYLKLRCNFKYIEIIQRLSISKAELYKIV